MQEKLEKSLIYEPLVNQIFPYLSPPFEVPFLECSKTWCKIFGIRDNQLVSFLEVAEANNVMGKEFSLSKDFLSWFLGYFRASFFRFQDSQNCRPELINLTFYVLFLVMFFACILLNLLRSIRCPARKVIIWYMSLSKLAIIWPFVRHVALSRIGLIKLLL